MPRIKGGEEGSEGCDTRHALATEPVEVRPHGRNRRQPPPAGVLARDLECLGAERRRQLQERGLDAGNTDAAVLPEHQRRGIAAAVHDDERRPQVGCPRQRDLGAPRFHTLEPVRRGRRTPGRSRLRTSPEQRGAEVLLVGLRSRGHAVRIAEDALDHTGTDRSCELVAVHADTNRIATAEHAEIGRGQPRQRADRTFLGQFHRSSHDFRYHVRGEVQLATSLSSR